MKSSSLFTLKKMVLDEMFMIKDQTYIRVVTWQRSNQYVFQCAEMMPET